MIDRSTLVTAWFVVLLVASLPAGVYASAQERGSASESALDSEDADVLDSLGCLPGMALENVTMNAYRQESTNLETESATVDPRENRTTEVAGTFRIETGYIVSDALCIDGLAADSDGIRLELRGVEFEETTLLGPRTDVAFETGRADSMTIVLPPEELLNLLSQVPGSVDMIETLRNLLGLDVEGPEGSESDGDSNETADEGSNGTVDDAVDNTTDAVDDTTDAVDDTVDETTDSVDEPVNDTTDTVDDTVDNTTDTVDDTVDDTTDTVDDTVDETTDAVGDTVDNTTETVDDSVDNTTDTVDDTVDNTTDAVDDTVDTTTDTLDGTDDDNSTDDDGATDDDNSTDDDGGIVDDTTDAVDDTVDTTTDVIDETVDTTTDLLTGG